MREFATEFYKSQAWKNTREKYAREHHYLCEKCLANGIYTPGTIVHHITELTPHNIEVPEITLDPSNLMLLCRDCHAEVHKATNTYHRKPKRYTVDNSGRVVAR